MCAPPQIFVLCIHFPAELVTKGMLLSISDCCVPGGWWEDTAWAVVSSGHTLGLFTPLVEGILSLGTLDSTLKEAACAPGVPSGMKSVYPALHCISFDSMTGQSWAQSWWLFRESLQPTERALIVTVRELHMLHMPSFCRLPEYNGWILWRIQLLFSWL